MKDYGKAFELFSQSAELGNALGINALGAMYFDGYGVEQDTAKAADCFTKAGEAGNTDGWYNLGHMYLTGAKGIEPDYAKSLEYFTKAADQGNEKGIYMIGYQYCKGAGVEQSYEKAYEYWCMTATSCMTTLRKSPKPTSSPPSWTAKKSSRHEFQAPPIGSEGTVRSVDDIGQNTRNTGTVLLFVSSSSACWLSALLSYWKLAKWLRTNSYETENVIRGM